ncbi:tRNA (adenosine(37)-N6)-threonylcarbamoyltransferase complex dimerization subunit type 1 TsaB [Cohnella cholangitidis]|uniref:tRNA (Adenosine(37)-N6)-threonylcarbamoyltransferase complex dimerization subunit type 1 TsaB n=1 Tax=Cohnella cholangitidis TaxID=2598458 RepID=A0A7G5C221_9BACL|nr:tRNA (adenosine(37)-N6)-threonylcarbamoyltransferase complex dimerization subunit type 1 TsaB [Cohnella cholangitidis]QMV43255.1 tRNA (adenosine(37)-N6)-threonylcarbamoyltransferase complex dimerization subunit type 1 TsaB [Cohnella cholangitidis]
MTARENKVENGSATMLSFDTSTGAFAAAIVRDGKRIDSIVSFTERNHSVRILSEIKELLNRNGIQGKDLDAIAVGQGPGSYTGVRIAVTVAKTLAWTWDKPLIGVSSLESLAYGAWNSLRKPDDNRADDRAIWIVPLMDARRGQVYTSRYEATTTGGWRAVDTDGIRLIADWAKRIEQEATLDSNVAEVWFVGDISAHQAAIELAEQSGARLRTMSFDMDAEAVGQLGELRFRLGERDDIHTFVPNYTQLAEAEAKLLAASKGE